MADHVSLETVAAPAAVVATDQNPAGSSEHYQKVKLVYGADNTFTDVVSTTTTPFPVALSDTDSGLLTTIDADTSAMVTDLAAIEVTQGTIAGDTTSLDDKQPALGTAAMAAAIPVTLASDDTLTAAANALLTSIDADTSALFGCVAGSELQVDIVSGGTGSTQYAEDIQHTTGDTGTMVLAVRNDTLAALAGTDGDYAPVQVNATGALFIQEGAAMDVSAATVTVDGTVTANPASGTIDTVTTVGTVTTITNDVNIADGGNAITVDWAGTAPPIGAGTEAAALRVTLATDSTGVVSIDDNGGAITVDGTVTANPASGTIDTVTTVSAVTAITNELPAGTQNIGDVDVATIAAGDNNIGNVDIVTLPASTNTLEVVGDVAHDAAAAGNPVAVAARAAATVEGLTQVDGADSTFLTADLNGCVVTRNGTTLEEVVSERVSNTDGAATACAGAFAAGGAGIHAYITAMTVHNAHASTNGYVDIRDGAAGSVLWTFPLPATGGATLAFDPPLKFSANTAVAYDVSAAITTVYLSFNGYFAQG